MTLTLKTAAAAALTLALTAGLSGAANAQDASLTPRFGAIDLQAGFTPDPVQRNVAAGGGSTPAPWAKTAWA